jgi:hypothetical protein
MDIVGYEEFKKQLPKDKRHLLTEEIYNDIVKLHDDSFDLREQLLTYTDVLNSGKYSLKNYAQAVKFVALLNMGKTAYDAYVTVFPERYKLWEERGTSDKDRYAEVTGYKYRKLVSEIIKRSMIPTYILNQDKLQQAVNVLADLMLNAKSEMVRQKSAEALLKELKPPEDSKISLDISVKKDESLVQLENKLNQLAELQVNAVKEGRLKPKEVVEMNIIDTEIEDG